MTADAWFTAVTIALILIGLIIGISSPALLTFAGVVVLLPDTLFLPGHPFGRSDDEE